MKLLEFIFEQSSYYLQVFFFTEIRHYYIYSISALFKYLLPAYLLNISYYKCLLPPY